MAELPPELEATVTNLSPFQRVYCEYRAKGLKQGEAAHRAGSNAADRNSRSRIGYQVEQLAGVKDYIFWLQQQRAKVAMIDQVEIIDKLRQIFDSSMRLDKFKEANTSVELMGKLIGLFGNSSVLATKALTDQASRDTVESFKDSDASDNETLDRMEKLQQMLKDVNK